MSLAHRVGFRGPPSVGFVWGVGHLKAELGGWWWSGDGIVTPQSGPPIQPSDTYAYIHTYIHIESTHLQQLLVVGRLRGEALHDVLLVNL